MVYHENNVRSKYKTVNGTVCDKIIINYSMAAMLENGRKS